MCFTKHFGPAESPTSSRACTSIKRTTNQCRHTPNESRVDCVDCVDCVAFQATTSFTGCADFLFHQTLHQVRHDEACCMACWQQHLDLMSMLTSIIMSPPCQTMAITLPFKQAPPAPHSSSQLLTAPHSSSQLLTASSSQLLTRAACHVACCSSGSAATTTGDDDGWLLLDDDGKQSDQRSIFVINSKERQQLQQKRQGERR